VTDAEDTSVRAGFAKQDAVEREAAQLRGRILFAYSRLDMQLGLCIAWTAGGHRIEAISRQVAKWDLNKRLNRLAKHVEATPSLDTVARAAYGNWIKEVHAVREERNQMVHGRWGVDAVRDRVINVVGLPSSADQGERPYALGELVAFLRTVERLRDELFELRERHPLGTAR
jgi:hypothetical protein